MPSTLPPPLHPPATTHAEPGKGFWVLPPTPRGAAWWGAGSTIDARPGGQLRIRYPDGTEAQGEVVAVRPPQEIVFTYGYASGTPMPPGGSTVTIRLERATDGTRLHLTHAFADIPVR